MKSTLKTILFLVLACILLFGCEEAQKPFLLGAEVGAQEQEVATATLTPEPTATQVPTGTPTPTITPTHTVTLRPTRPTVTPSKTREPTRTKLPTQTLIPTPEGYKLPYGFDIYYSQRMKLFDGWDTENEKFDVIRYLSLRETYYRFIGRNDYTKTPEYQLFCLCRVIEYGTPEEKSILRSAFRGTYEDYPRDFPNGLDEYTFQIHYLGNYYCEAVVFYLQEKYIGK